MPMSVSCFTCGAPMSRPLRSLLLYGALLATLGATWWASRLPDDGEVTTVEPVGRQEAQPAGRPVKPADTSEAGRATRALPGISRSDAFAARDWTPPAPPPPAPPPPAPPTTPPLPFSYLGKWSAEEGLSVFVLQGNTPRIVRSGDVLDGMWRVDKVQPNALVFTYLPLNSSVTLNIGESL
jgi:hypothetical protein